MGWEFPLLLLAALLAMGGLSLWQTQRLTADINTMARACAGPDRHLVSGRGKGRLYGAIAVLVVDVARAEVVEAGAMTGVSVFARLRPAPQLAGPLASVLDRAPGKALHRAVEDALTRLPSSTPRPPTARSAAGRPPRTTPRFKENTR